VDALRELYPINEMYLHLPYFPGARQDRRMVDGEPLTVKVYADIINSLKFDMVTILDSHSDVAPALIDNCKSLSNHEFVENVTNDLGGDVVLISPDAGSNKKMHSLCKYLDMDSFIRCDKDRDVSTGAIKGFNVFHDDFNKDTEYLIVDDICDGGGTFTGLAKELKTKGATRLSLAVTHGIFSKGFSQLNNYFDVIYTTKSFDGQRSSKTKEL
jgi:ribose-phosphate pyrophosphokinase